MSDRHYNLRKKLRSYRRAKVGAIFLAVLALPVLLMLLITGHTNEDAIRATVTSALFWLAMAYICHLRAKLIRIELSQLPGDAA